KVEPPEFALGQADRRLDVRGLADIGADRRGFAARGGDFSDDFVCRGFVEIRYHHGATALGEADCRRAADSRRAPGNHADLTIKSHGATSSSWLFHNTDPRPRPSQPTIWNTGARHHHKG